MGWLLYLLYALIALQGCMLANNAGQGDSSPAAKNQVRRSSVMENEFSHLIVKETPYYTDGPQQGRPADGLLPVGTEVRLISQSGSYARVQTKDGVIAFVASCDLE